MIQNFVYSTNFETKFLCWNVMKSIYLIDILETYFIHHTSDSFPKNQLMDMFPPWIWKSFFRVNKSMRCGRNPEACAVPSLTLRVSMASHAALFSFHDGCFVWIYVATPEALFWQVRKHAGTPWQAHTHTLTLSRGSVFPLTACYWAVRCDRRGHSTVTETHCLFAFLLWKGHAEIFFQIKQKLIKSPWLDSSLRRPPVWSAVSPY